MRKKQFHINQLYNRDTMKNFANLTAESRLINPKTYKNYPKASFQKYIQILHNEMWSSHFNVIRQIEDMEKYAQNVSKKLKNLLLVYSHDLGYMNVFLYKIIVTSNNQALTKNDDGYGIVDDGYNESPFKMYSSAISAYKRHLNRSHSNLAVLASTIEDGMKSVASVTPFHVHSHWLLASYGEPITSDQVDDINGFMSRHLHHQVNQSPSIHTALPLRNYWTKSDVVINGNSTDGDFNSAEQYVRYIFKSKSLPIAKNYRQYYQFHQMTFDRQQRILTALLNSSYRVRLHSYVRVGQRIRKAREIADDLAFIAWLEMKLTAYDVQPSLFNVSKYVDHHCNQFHQISGHHYSELEATRRFYGLNIYTGQPLKCTRRADTTTGRHLNDVIRDKSIENVSKMDADNVFDNHGQIFRTIHRIQSEHHDKQTELNINVINTS